MDKSNPASCLAVVESVFSDLRSSQGELEIHFSELFDQLESMSLELFARHKCLELSTQHRPERNGDGGEHERRFREFLEGVQTEMQRVGTEFRAMREDVDRNQADSRQFQESVREELQRLAGAAAELAARQWSAGNDEQLAEALETTRRQEAAWRQDRAGLEAELDAARQHALQQSEALAEQRCLATQQQAELAGELKRMRSLLEGILKQMNQPLGGDGGEAASSSSENAALASMLAQFEILQRDLAQRRAGRQTNTPTNQRGATA
jgi:DNA repair exonuclease SbcCD ATPase subunit